MLQTFYSFKSVKLEIILAGVSINALVGDNGIITVAKKAKENTELAQLEEEKQLNNLYEELVNREFDTFESLKLM